MHALQEIVKILWKWIIIAFVVAILFIIVRSLIPSFNDNTVKKYTQQDKNTSEAATTTKRRGLLPPPGSFNLISSSSVKVEPLLNPDY